MKASVVVKSVSSGAILPELGSHLCHFRVCDNEHNHLISLYLFPYIKWTLIIATDKVVVKIERVNTGKALKTIPGISKHSVDFFNIRKY